MKLTCFDAVDLAIAGAIESHGFHETCNYRMDVVQADCKRMDKIADENDCDSVSASVDTMSGALTVSLRCPVIEFDTSRNAFLDIIEHADLFRFSFEDDNVLLSFTYQGVLSK